MLEKYTNVPREYGEVAFFWWVGEPLTRERLTYELEQLEGRGVCGLQINYCHSDSGGRIYGLTIDNEPKLFSDEWWELVGWFIGECKQRGIAVALSDYTISSPGQGYYMDTILEKHPEITGKVLELVDGEVVVRDVPYSVDPMNPKLGDYVIEEFYGKFDKHFPNEGGRGLDFFFSDELNFNIRGNLWNDEFAENFKRIKGYDIVPKLKAIFEDVGDETQKIRLDYYDVIVRLSEDGYFKKIYDWNEERGMTFGCDHGGRGRDVTEFGDYFRTQKWTQGPGNDQPNLASDIIKTKVSSSIAHMYKRPRTWLEGFYGSGWGTSSNQLADAVFRNFCVGHNLLTLHGLYYTTYGGYWEWAPPCNHFRMPYWKHMDRFLGCTKQLSYLMTRGVHVCDVAIVYPTAALEGGINGDAAVSCAFETAEHLYRSTVDFDFIDFESIDRATIENGRLCVSGECFRVVIVPSMETVRFEMIAKLNEFAKSGGIVLFVGSLPVAADRIGRNDPELERLVDEIAAITHPVSTKEEALGFIRTSIVSDVVAESKPYIQHRRIDGNDVYFIYGAKQGERVFLRATGAARLFDPWTGNETELCVIKQDETGTELNMPLGEKDMQIIAFDASCQPRVGIPAVTVSEEIIEGEWDFRLIPTMDNRYGDFIQPPTDGCVGAQARFLKYSQGDRKKEIQCGYETYFYKLGALQEADDDAVLALDDIGENSCVELDGKSYSFKPYDFSLRYGILGDAGCQHSYHGLKGLVSDEFIALGEKVITHANSNSRYDPEPEGNYYYLWTAVYSDSNCEVYVKTGELEPARIYLDKRLCDWQSGGRLTLHRGINELLLRYDSAGRTHFILDCSEETPRQTYPLATTWYNNKSIMRYCPNYRGISDTCHFSFTAPPATEVIHFLAKVPARVYFDDVEADVTYDGSRYTARPESVNVHTVNVRIETTTAPGSFESAICDYIDIDCGEGKLPLGDWGEIGGLRCYSGGAVYSRKLDIIKSAKVELDLGDVGCSCELRVNGKSAGVKLTAPYRFDVTGLIHDGENLIEAEIYNTLYNHYLTIPTGYNNNIQRSGLIGDVKLIYTNKG